MAIASTSTALARKIGAAIREASRKRVSEWWYTPHMAAASRAIAERLPLVDLVVEIRDARIPLSSACELLKDFTPSSRKIVVLNKVDLANDSQTKDWIKFFELHNCITYGVNAHNMESIKKLLNFLQNQVKGLRQLDHAGYTGTILLAGIPNVGKSALANSLHKIGRISAAEKGKLKHAVVSPQPCETKDISSMKITSNPNIYILDTPGVLPPIISDVEICSKLALGGTIRDCLVGEKELARYFLSILNSSEEYKKWAHLSAPESECSFMNNNIECSSGLDLEIRRKRQYPSDHTQDFVVQDVRCKLMETISTFASNAQDQDDIMNLIELQFKALCEAFRINLDGDDVSLKISTKLLNLFRTGRIGHYTLDVLPNDRLASQS